MRRFAVVLLLLAGFAAAGCTPPYEPIVGLTTRDGAPVVLLVACSARSSVSVYEESPSISSTAAAAAWAVSTGAAAELEVAELTLFAPPPPGWSVTDSRLAELRPDGRYEIFGVSFRKSLRVSFAAGDVPGLAPDQVLTAKGRVVPRASFEKTGKEGCR